MPINSGEYMRLFQNKFGVFRLDEDKFSIQLIHIFNEAKSIKVNNKYSMSIGNEIKLTNAINIKEVLEFLKKNGFEEVKK
jgi:hypothetical protein